METLLDIPDETAASLTNDADACPAAVDGNSSYRLSTIAALSIIADMLPLDVDEVME
jgi:hypothetical protein